MLASGGVDGQVCLWDLESQPGAASAPARQLGEHRSHVWAVTFSPDGRLLASGSTDGRVILWDVATGGIVREFLPGSISTLAFSPDGETFAAGGENGLVHSWAVKTGQRKEPLRSHVGAVHAVAFSPDGRWLATGGLDGTIPLIDRASGERVHTFRVSLPVTNLAFSPDSQSLAATTDGPGPSVRLWDLTTRAPRTAAGHTKRVVGLAYHPAGHRIATGSQDGTARLWEVSPGAEPGRVFDFHHTGPAQAVAFSPSGRHLAVGLGNGMIAIIRTPPDLAR
jgi:WD40 repeat protein